ncbi:3-phosphoshikimate 1-carboxyvinyltransferase [Antarcticibacterium flavum]|uniref:3-phosphoshikimate 1-carboxyvinyltransferase n=1 Tax=Antarcticibacterium flavum TaxID=2058175 RepID=A0A5B7X189_9FLAO|nr:MULTISPECIES: 3-phosphoshikimate 1-carboxyvinyltransferase [Antarcticibacterium]MCM4159885.1 3-phosphoshikimate 1-carboxyvinyltransferase [Antarcticibacterium sp. W02-3]QCY68885.1 3-phosphoshikimate 1-carboxyvinyltransferase [Antarcticibacterium flavum]
MNKKISHPTANLSGKLKVTGSKSESNRALILQALYPLIELENLSNSDDTRVLQEALNRDTGTIDIHHAGTAMRFLTAYYASKEGANVLLTGSKRMKERPIELLVDALRKLGAQIEYTEKEGFPPLKIEGKRFEKTSVSLKANISSQYISALMLIAPSLPEGLEIKLEGPVTSTPYINMTLELLRYFGFKAQFDGQRIDIAPGKLNTGKTLIIESDWSSASYFYSLVAISEQAEIELSSYRQNSRQGDAEVAAIFEHLGVKTEYYKDRIKLTKKSQKHPRGLKLDFQNTPDLAQTIAVCCMALGVSCELQGLHTLKIKETDRLLALKTEMEKFGATVDITHDSLKLNPPKNLNEGVSVATYNDHRMAMAFAPLGLKVSLEIEEAGVVSKSYPEFWEHLEILGFKGM